MRPSRMFILLGIAATAGGIIQTLVKTPDVVLTVFTLAEIAGRICGLFVVSALVPAIWVLARRKSSESVIGALGLGLLVAASWTYFGVSGLRVERDLKKSVFSPVGCSHRVIFPEQPQLKEIVVAGGIKVLQASVHSGVSVIRAECVPISGKFPRTEAAVAKQIELLAQQNGLLPYEHHIEVRQEDVYGFARGSKLVSGRSVTYSMVLVVSDASFMALVAGCPSDSFPTSVISDFLKSIQPAR